MRFSRFFLSLSVLAALGTAANVAEAAPKGKAGEEKKLPKIEATGISEFDSVFMEAKGIHDILDAEDGKLKEARKQVAVALGVAEDQPLKTAFEELKKKANGKIKVALKGKMPRLEASEAIPENVQTGIDAVNKLLDVAEAGADQAEKLGPKAESLGQACADFPDRLTKMGLDPMKLAGATPKVLSNTKATGATYDRVKRLGETTVGVATDVKSTFGE
jgi:hypothetical protein